MATTLEYDQQLPAGPPRVLALLQDPEFVRAKAERTGAFDISVDVTNHPDGRVSITSTRSMPASCSSVSVAASSPPDMR